MFDSLVEEFRLFAAQLRKKEEEPEVQPCFVRFSYVHADEQGNERLMYGHNFVRDMKDAMDKARSGAMTNPLEKVWIAYFVDTDPKLDLIYGPTTDGDASIPISDDRVVETMYKHYKEKVKDPKAARKEQAAINAKTRGFKQRTRIEDKPRIRVPAGPTVVVTKEPEKPAYRRWVAVSAALYQDAREQTAATAPPEATVESLPAITSFPDDEHQLPWSEYGGLD